MPDTIIIQGAVDDQTIEIAGLDSEHRTIEIQTQPDGSYKIVSEEQDHKTRRVRKGPAETEQRETI
jgi:hypothetical protein